MPELPLPPALRQALAAPLQPVTPVRSPQRRAAAFALVCVTILVVVPLIWGRGRPLPSYLLAAGWVLQTASAVLVLAAAIRESTPGRLLSPLHLAALILAVAAIEVGSAIVWFAIAPLAVPPNLDLRIARICLTREYLLGLLPLAIAAAILRRGLVARPAVGGALAGLAAGLSVESGWRMYCSITSPLHTFVGHIGAIALLAATGAAAGVLLVRRRPLRQRVVRAVSRPNP